MSIWVSLFLPRLPLTALMMSRQLGSPQDAKSEASRQRIVIEGQPAVRVIALNKAAETAGIGIGMSYANALSLAPNCEPLLREPACETEALQMVARVACHYASHVSVALTDAVVLDVAPSLSLFRGIDHLVKSLSADVRALRLPVWPAAAPTPLAAWLLSRTGQRHKCIDGNSPTDPLVTAAFWHVIATLDVAMLPEAAQHLSALRTLGLNTIDDLLRQPRAGLNQRFGHALGLALDRLCGRAPHVLPLFSTPPQFSERLNLPVPIANLDMLQFGIARLLRAMCRFLAVRGLGVLRFLLTFRHEDHADTAIVIGVGLTRSEAHLIRVVRERLSRETLVAPVDALQIESLETNHLLAAQHGLLPDNQMTQHTTDDVMDRIRARLDDAHIHRLAAHADHRPEYAYRYLNINQANTPSHKVFQAKVPESARPVWLLANPRLLPSHPQASGYQLLNGPERIESGWWDQPVRRDYFTARGKHGNRCWLFRTPSGQWFLHGLFA